MGLVSALAALSAPHAWALRASLIWLAAAGTAPVASAQDRSSTAPPRAQLQLFDCEHTEDLSGPLVELLRVELMGDGVGQLTLVTPPAGQSTPGAQAPPDGSDPHGLPLAHIAVQALPCEAVATRFVVTIDDRVTQKSVQRAVDLADVEASSRPRVLALSIAELLRASWAELAMPDAPESAVPVPLRVRDSVRVRPRENDRDPRHEARPEESRPALDAPRPVNTGTQSAHLRSRVTAEALWRAHPGAGTSLLGGRAGLLVPLESIPLILAFDGSAATGTALDRLGRMSLGLLTAGALVAYRGTSSGLTLDLGPQIEVGWAWASGDAYDATTITLDGSGVVVLLSATARLSVALTEALAGHVTVQVGGALRGFEALSDGRSVAGVHGAGATLGIGLTLSP